MRYGRGHFDDYFDKPADEPARPVHHAPVTVQHKPELAHFYDRLHRGAIKVIDDFANRASEPAYAGLIRECLRILEHDAHNASPERRDEYVDDLVRAITTLAESPDRR